MKEIQKSKKLSNVAYDVRGPVLDAANAMEAAGAKILKLNIGNPGAFGFEAPGRVVGAIGRTLALSEGYSDSKGILPAREAIAAYDKSKGIEGVGVDDIYTGNGVSELIMMCMQGLLDCGDEILIPAPDYPLWTG
ncbi:MAG: aminotransferase class I/II-fold pyridoxal phosphate-dependent enzyme, partial [Oscillospiraceae bacterium]|nr:aminotransferase class I/II-fold pyridoxal phosphate-dependent enzyme [Oscillospiraceae bacterium]